MSVPLLVPKGESHKQIVYTPRMTSLPVEAWFFLILATTNPIESCAERDAAGEPLA